jgi:hypothetical protein
MPKYYFDRLEYLDSLIQRKGTGCPATLAKKLCVSKRTVFEYIDILKFLGASIKYDQFKETYIYENPGKFSFRFMEENRLKIP